MSRNSSAADHVGTSSAPPGAGESTPRARRLRARRIRVKELKVGEVVAHARHASLGAVTATVEDLSLYGMALVIPAAAASTSLVLAGDRLDQVRVEYGTGVLYEGSVIVRRVTESDEDLVIGVELQPGALDLGALYRLGERQTFADRLRTADGDGASSPLSPAFTSWVANARNYLDTTKQFLDEEERALAGLDLPTREERLSQYLEEAIPLVVARMNAASKELSDLVCDLAPEAHAAHRAYVRKHLVPFLMHSPLLRRAYEKPLGYAGDYEMMNMLYRDHAEGSSLFAKTLNVYAAGEPAAQANINRIEYLGDMIRAALKASNAPRVRVASVGCGPARELVALLERSPELGCRLDVALIDQEERVITFCERTLGPLAARTGMRLHLIRESVRRLLTSRQLSATLGQRDIIYSAGLFDYLNTRSFQALLASLYEALAPGGMLAVGNVAAHNPTRWFMEYWLDWFLIHRSAEELLAFAADLHPAPASVEVDAEPLGVNLFLRIRT